MLTRSWDMWLVHIKSSILTFANLEGCGAPHHCGSRFNGVHLHESLARTYRWFCNPLFSYDTLQYPVKANSFMSKEKSGAETYRRLSDWQKGSAESERLASHLLVAEGYSKINPAQPLGGADNTKDILCHKDEINFVSSVYFPRGDQPFGKILKKFKGDLNGVVKHGVKGIVFVTNQKLTEGQKAKLTTHAAGIRCELLHLERIRHLLDSPACYGIRLEFLDIEMTKEEQVSFFKIMHTELRKAVERIDRKLGSLDLSKMESPAGIRVLLAEIKEFRSILDSVSQAPNGLVVDLWRTSSNVRDLYVPLRELKEFRDILGQLTSNNQLLNSVDPGVNVSHLRVPLAELKEFQEVLMRVTNYPMSSTSSESSCVRDLKVPLDELRIYETSLDRILEKIREIKDFKNK